MDFWLFLCLLFAILAGGAALFLWDDYKRFQRNNVSKDDYEYKNALNRRSEVNEGLHLGDSQPFLLPFSDDTSLTDDDIISRLCVRCGSTDDYTIDDLCPKCHMEIFNESLERGDYS